jgi:hypothetical protein
MMNPGQQMAQQAAQQAAARMATRCSRSETDFLPVGRGFRLCIRPGTGWGEKAKSLGTRRGPR